MQQLELFKYGTFTSHSGLKLNWKIECDALSENEWDCLAAMIVERESRPFCKAEGIPRGGLPLAKALNKYATNKEEDRILICDDIWTTGRSFKEYTEEHYPDWIMNQGMRWVVFARKMPLDGTKALFSMNG